ncbi:MAG: metalloregulator ArsR/SmtB family transcription factor [Gammaproteobacteria bacterium]|jgi:ArsR family transcriptional regulator
MKALLKITKALADVNRVKILKLLQQKPLCVCEIQELIQLAQSTISTHLKILTEANLITFTKDGLWTVYELTEPGNIVLKQMIENLLSYLEEDKEILTMLKKVKTIDRNKICCRKED